MYRLNSGRPDAQRGSGASRKFAAYSPIRRRGAREVVRLIEHGSGAERSGWRDQPVPRQTSSDSIRRSEIHQSVHRPRPRAWIGAGSESSRRRGKEQRSQNFPGLESSCTEIGGHWLRVPSVDTDVQQHQLPPGSSTRSAEARSAASWPARRRFSAASSVITYQKILPISIDRMARVRYVRDAMRSQLRTFPRAHGPSRRSLRTSCSPFEKKRRSLGTRCRRQDK